MQVINSFFYKDLPSQINSKPKHRPYGAVRSSTEAFQAFDTGSNPVGGTISLPIFD